jgi:hypothetical protein
LDWSRRKFGLLPAIENGNLQGNQPPSKDRLTLWLRAGVRVPGRPDSVIVKLHTHGVWEPNQDVLLGKAMVEVHETLATMAAGGANFRYHYVTAYEIANLVVGGDYRSDREVAR